MRHSFCHFVLCACACVNCDSKNLKLTALVIGAYSTSKKLWVIITRSIVLRWCVPYFRRGWEKSIHESVTRTSNNVRHVCDFRYASNFLRLVYFSPRWASNIYERASSVFETLLCLRHPLIKNGIVFLTSAAESNLAVKSAGRQTGLWSISTVRG